MPSDAEVQLNRLQTTAWIDYDPRTIVLQTVDAVPTSSGGFTRDTSSRVPQIGRLISRGDVEARPRPMVDGEIVEDDFVLVFPWDALVERGDWFYLDGLKYEVVWVNDGPTRFYERKCGVTLRG